MRLSLPDVTLDLVTDRGVFAADGVDTGTRVLLSEACAMPQGAVDLVDVGCGYGAVAVTLARRAPDATVWAVDVNERALELTRENARVCGVDDRVRAVPPDDVPPDVAFAALWSNPPIRIGKVQLHALLLRWLGRLAEDGVGWLVVNKHLGSDSLAAWLRTEGFEAARRASRVGYRVLEVRRA